MIMREEFIDKTDRRKTPKFSYVFERIYDYAYGTSQRPGLRSKTAEMRS